MKKNIGNIIIGFLIFLLSGCYESDVPLSQKPSENIDARLINYWISTPSKKNKSKIKLVVFQYSEKEYLITWKQENDETIFARGYTTSFNNIKIINLQNIKDLEKKERTFVFFK